MVQVNRRFLHGKGRLFLNIGLVLLGGFGGSADGLLGSELERGVVLVAVKTGGAPSHHPAVVIYILGHVLRDLLQVLQRLDAQVYLSIQL